MNQPTSYQPGSMRWLRHDPRYYQIAVLASLLVYGIGWLSFDVGGPQVVIILGTVLATQWVCTRLTRLPLFDPRSALISGLSLCLLLRTNDPLLMVAAAIVAIASKFVFKWSGKHVFNPTNFAIV